VQRVLLTVVHVALLSWASFLMFTWVWFSWFWLLSGGRFSFPWRWIGLMSVLIGVVLTHGMWGVRRKQWRLARTADAIPRLAMADEEVIHEAYKSMTPDVVRQIVSTVGRFVADRGGRPSPESALPLPRAMIELAFIKALREWPEGPELEALKTLHVCLDAHFLTEAEYKLLTRWDDLISSAPEASAIADPSSPEVKALIEDLADDRSKQAVELRRRLAEKAEERLKLNRQLRGQ
jgi:hypothetical protein